MRKIMNDFGYINDHENFEEDLEDIEMTEDDFFEEFFENYEENYKEYLKKTEGLCETTEEETEAFNNAKSVFTKDVIRSLNDFETKVNNNVVVVGASECGKTASYIESDLIKPKGCYVLSDPKGTLLKKHRRRLEKPGYKVIVMDFHRPERSVRWRTYTPHRIYCVSQILRYSTTARLVIPTCSGIIQTSCISAL